MKNATALIAGFLSLLASLAGSTVRADELYTRDGEHLSGRVVGETAEVVEFESRAFGSLRVPRSSIARLERGSLPESAETGDRSEAPAVPGTPGPEKSGQGKESAKAEGTGNGPEAEAPVTAETKSMDRALLRILQPLRGWKTVFRFGLMARRGRDSDTAVDLRYRTERIHPESREYLLSFGYYRKDDVYVDGTRKTKDNNLEGEFRFRRYFRSRWFFQANTLYYRDPTVNLLNEASQAFGVGYWLLKGKRARLSFGSIAGVQYAEYTSSRGWNFVAGAFQDLQCELPLAFKAREVFYYLQDPWNRSNHILRFNLEISQPLNGVVSLGFVWDYTFAGEEGGNIAKNQHRMGLNLGIHF